MLLLLLACAGAPVDSAVPVELQSFPEPDAFTAPRGPGGPTASFTEDQLFEPCAWLTGGEGDAEHHNLVVMHDGYLLMPWAPEDGGGGITFFDFSDPCAPEKVGEAWADEMRETHTLATGIVDGREYLAVDTLIDGETGGVGFWDITDPTAPEFVSSLNLPNFDYPDAYFFVSLSSTWVGDHLYVSSGLSGVFIVDVSDPLNPELVAQHQVVGHLVGALHVIGTVAMASSAGMARTVFYDLSNPEVLSALPGGEFDVEGPDGDMQNYYFANVGGGWALFARKSDGGGPIVYDLKHPEAPTLLGGALNDDGAGGYISRHHEALFQGESEWATVFDASDLSNIVELGRVDVQGDLDTLSPVGNVAVASVDSGAAPGQASGVFPWAVEPDARGPSLGVHFPREGETWVATTAKIGVAFDENIEPRSVFEGSFRVWDDAGQAVPGRFNVMETVANFTPDAPLEEGRSYWVEIPAGGVTDVNGNPTEEAWRFAFSTGAELVSPW